MARYGSWRPLAADWVSQAKLTTPDIIVLHTMSGSLAGTDNMFRQDGYGGVESHFGVGADGTVWQWQDTSRIAEANFRGNHRCISIETADKGTGFPAWTGSDVPSWTDLQLNDLAYLVAFLCKAHNIPCELIPDSKPGRRGVGYHRLGIDPWRVANGEVWSTSRGKICPGDRRILQIPAVIAHARRILAGQEDDMPLTDKDLDAIADRVWGKLVDNSFGDRVATQQVLNGIEHRLADLQKDVDELKDK